MCHNLGSLCLSRDRVDEAEELLLRALRIKEKVLGPAHPSVANTCVFLKRVYEAKGMAEKAAEYGRRGCAGE